MTLLLTSTASAAAAATNQPSFFIPASAPDAPTKSLQIVGNHLFVAAWGRGVQVLDISDPVNPRWAGGWNPRRFPMGIHVVGDHAYVADRRAGLSVLDVRNPANPVLLGNVPTPDGDAMAVHVAGRHAYVADYPSGFRIVDVTNPTRPVLRGGASMPQGATSLQAVGSHLYATEPNGLHVFDVRDPLNPVRVGERKVLGPASRVQQVGQHVFLATGQSGLLVLDVTDPARLETLDRLMFETNNLPIIIWRTNSFTQIGYTWMLTNVGFRTLLERQHSTNLPSDMEALVEAVRHTPHYHDLARRGSGLSRNLRGLHVSGHHALALGDGLELVDVSDVTQPKRIGQFKMNVPTWDVRGSGRYAYVMDNGANIHVIDLGDPTHPVQVARFDSRNYSSAVLGVSAVDPPPPAAVPPQIYTDVPTVTDAPELIDPERLPDGAFAFTLLGIGKASYVIQASQNLASWSPVLTNTLPVDGRLRIIDPHAASASHRYYRAMKQ